MKIYSENHKADKIIPDVERTYLTTIVLINNIIFNNSNTY